MFGAFTFGQPYFAQGSAIYTSSMAGTCLAFVSPAVRITGTGRLQASGISTASGSFNAFGLGNLSAVLITFVSASASASGSAFLAGTGFGEANGTAELHGSLSLSGVSLDWALGLCEITGAIGPSSAQLAGRLLCFSFSSAGILAKGIIRVPQDLLPGDRVHVGPRCFAGRCCPGDQYLPVLRIASNKSTLRVAVGGIGVWIPMSAVRSAVRPTRSPDALPSRVLDDGQRTIL